MMLVFSRRRRRERGEDEFDLQHAEASKSGAEVHFMAFLRPVAFLVTMRECVWEASRLDYDHGNDISSLHLRCLRRYRELSTLRA